ncbi:MAG: tetratricopeptide repeat protein [Planctomycetota bacterium]
MAHAEVSLGATYAASGRLEEAKKVTFRTYKTLANLLDKQHPTRISVTYNLGVLYYRLKEYGNAVPYLESALQHRTENSGISATTPLKFASVLSKAYILNGQASKAVALCHRYPLSAASLHNSAVYLQREKQYKEAIEVWNLAKQAYASDEEKLVVCGQNIATCLARSGRLSEAIQFFDNRISDCDSQFGPDDPKTIFEIEKLLSFVINLKNQKVSRACASQYIDSKQYRKFSLSGIKSLYIVGGRCLMEGQPEKAIRYLETALELAPTMPDGNRVFLEQILSGLAEAYRDSGNVDEALQMLESQEKMLTERKGPNHPDTLAAVATQIEFIPDDQIIADGPVALMKLKDQLGSEDKVYLNAIEFVGRKFTSIGHYSGATELLNEVVKTRISLGLEKESYNIRAMNWAPLHMQSLGWGNIKKR